MKYIKLLLKTRTSALFIDFFACLFCLSSDALELLREALWIKQDSGPEELEDLLRSLEEWGDITVDQPDEVKQQGAIFNMLDFI